MTEKWVDRLSIRRRPEQTPLMYQSWRRLLFMHWSLPPEILRPHVPSQLEIDTHDGMAWIAITPFLVGNLRLAFTPALPWLSDFNEINVRTYVHHEGVPGVWFFSLDADSRSAVIGARRFFHLPYFNAGMEVVETEEGVMYRAMRKAVRFRARYSPGTILGEAIPGTLPFFLVERYCLYSLYGNRLYRARVHHDPWILQKAAVTEFSSSMFEGQGLPDPHGDPLLHYSEIKDVAVWPVEEVR